MKKIISFKFILVVCIFGFWHIENLSAQKITLKKVSLTESCLLCTSTPKEKLWQGLEYKLGDGDWNPVGLNGKYIKLYLNKYKPAAQAFGSFEKATKAHKTLAAVAGVFFASGLIISIIDDKDTFTSDGWQVAKYSTLGLSIPFGLWSNAKRNKAKKQFNKSVSLYNSQFE